MADVAVRFDDGLAATRGRFSELAGRLAVSLSIHLGLVKVQMTGPARNRPEPSATLHSLLEVLVRAAGETPTLLVVDEFSSISRVEGAAGALRTAVQGHYQEIGLVFAGSQPSMMRTLFSDRVQPFYGQADLVDIGPLSAAAVEEIVASGFSSTGRSAGRLGGLIFTFAGGHPQRTMQLADASWRHTSPKGRGDDAWADALDEVRRMSADGMERLYSRYNAGERAVLRALAQSGSVYGLQAELLDLSKGTATHARRALMDGGDLAEIDGELRVVDPLLADWIRSRFPL